MNEYSGPVFMNERHAITTSLRITELDAHLLYNYLLRLYLNELHDHIKIEYILGTSNLELASFEQPNYNFDNQLQSYLMKDTINICKLIYNDSEYFLTISKYCKALDKFGIPVIGFYTSMFPYKVLDKNFDIIHFLLKRSKQNSVFAKKILRLNSDLLTSEQIMDRIEIIEPRKVCLEDIFIPKIKKEQCTRFINAVKNYENEKCALRFLFNGAPGTAKTQLINAIMNELSGLVNFFVMNGVEVSLSEVFNFLNQFEKCVLVIDDLDLVVGNRETRNYNKDMALFLSTLDGYLPSNLFILASTNDKNLVDLAASRPGRFDMILDIDVIESDNYLSLIKRETNDEELISFFDSKLLQLFADRKVTGAYIVSLIKQLKNVKYIKGFITSNDFIDYLNLTYNGFYKSTLENLKAVGF